MNLDYHAILTIHGLPSLNKRQQKGLATWLKSLSIEIEKEKDLKIFSKRFRARYMK